MPSEKKKLTKMEKIAELQGKLKLLQAENQRLKEMPSTSNHGGLDWGFDGGNPSSPSKTSSDVEKLKDALKALKRVTVKQEMTLSNLRQRAKQRRKEIEQRDKVILELRNENGALKKAHDKIQAGGDDDMSKMKARLADLELQLAKEQTSKEEQKRKLKESQDGISSLQSKLATIKGGGRAVNRHSSSASLTSAASFMSDGTSGEDLIRLKKELAKKAEKIANLQYDLENAKEEIQDLKQKDSLNNSFPLTTSAQSDDDFFETDDDEEDFWS